MESRNKGSINVKNANTKDKVAGTNGTNVRQIMFGYHFVSMGTSPVGKLRIGLFVYSRNSRYSFEANRRHSIGLLLSIKLSAMKLLDMRHGYF